MKKKVCKKCKLFTANDTCPICKGNDFASSWKGRIIIEDPEKSEIAKKINFKEKGNFAIKTR